jgi:hypothetical protein
MSNLTNTKTAKSIGIVVAIMMFLGMVAVPVTHALTLSELVELFIALEVIPADKAEQARSVLSDQSSDTGSSSSVCPYTWTTNLTKGSTGDDVLKLQMFLNADADTKLASSGAGSPGNETSYFGSVTNAGVAKFQDKYASEVLTPIGLSAGTGYFGTMSRAKANELCKAAAPAPSTGGDTSTPAPSDGGDTSTPAPVGTGLKVMKSASQPVNSLAPQNAARVPFTKIDLTAGSDGDVTVNSVVVERIGVAADTSFSGIVLLNEDGTLIGIAKTLNSNHQATVGTSFVIKAGKTKTVVIAANMAADLSQESGETPSLRVIGVNTSATVDGTFPIVGATHTINSSLSIGSLTTARGSLDPGAGLTKEVGTTGFNMSGIKITAGSAEDTTLKSIRWYQSGSAGQSDLENIVTVVDGVSYDSTVDTTGKFFTTVFPDGGILIKKGFSKDITLKGDLAGGSNRTVDFDIDRRTDLHVVGNLYGYGITPPLASSAATADGSAFNNADNPYWDASQHTVANGSINVSSWTAGVPAQNVAENVLDQPIAGFSVDIKGEAVSVGSLAFNFTLTSGDGATTEGLADVTNVTLVDENGSVLAGPVDGSGATTKSGSITLTDTITFPVGVTNMILKAKLGTDFGNNDQIAASTTPSSGWTTVTGQVTGNSITPSPTSAVSGPTQTVKAGSLTISVSSQPPAQTVIAGSDQFLFAKYIFDAGSSGEDIRVTSIPLYYDTNGTATDVTNCTMYDGATKLNSGSDILNPTAVGSSTTLTFEGSGILLPKGTTKTLELKCDLITGTTNLYWWGLDSGATMTSATGVTSGQTIAETLIDGNGQVMTAAAGGTYSVSNDGSVLYKVVQAGSTDVILGKLKFEAGTAEDLDLKQIALQLGATASNSPADLVGEKITIWNGSTKVGEAQFGSGNSSDYATSTLSTPVRVERGESVTLTMKGDLTSHNGIYLTSSNLPGQFIQVDWDGDNAGLNGNYATGVQSGSTIGDASGELTTTSDVTTNGMRVFRTVPTVEDVTTTTSLAAGSDLYGIKVTAGSGRDVTMRAMSFYVQSVGTGAISGFQLFGPSGAVNSTAVASTSAQSSNVSGNTRLRIQFDDANVDRIVSAGTSKTFRLRASTIGGLTSANTETVTIYLLSDSVYASSSNRIDNIQNIEAAASTSDAFIWSPNSTTTAAATNANNQRNDWANGYGIPGFPGVGQNMSARVFTH